MNNFFVRALTGIIFVLAIVLAIFVHPIGFLVLFLVVSVLSMIELERLLCSKPDLWLLLNAIFYVQS